jgi:hypothetical protein
VSVAELAVASAMKAPDIGSISIVAFGAALGAIAGGLAGRVRRIGRERTTHLTNDAGLFGGLVGILLYVTSWLW